MIALAKKDLQLHEINGALSINIELRNINFKARRLRPSVEKQIDNLCGVLVQIGSDDSVSFVHSTARRYGLLISTKSHCVKD